MDLGFYVVRNSISTIAGLGSYKNSINTIAKKRSKTPKRGQKGIFGIKKLKHHDINMNQLLLSRNLTSD